MFSSTILDVAIGLVFVFMTVSVVSGAAVEAIAGFSTWRSTTLLKGIKDLVNDESFDALAAQLYQHALVNPRNSGTGSSQVMLRKNAPAYVDPKHFAEALLDILNTGVATLTPAPPGGPAAPAHPGPMINADLASINAAIDHVVPAATNRQINDLLKSIARRTNGNLNRMKVELAEWFDSAMDRLSGYYKRHTMAWNFGIALVLAVLLNISTTDIAQTLWAQPSKSKVVENSIGGKEAPDVTAAFEALDKLSLPIGWSHIFAQWEQFSNPGKSAWEPVRYTVSLFLGWLITATATLFGAPFWFDALQRVVRLKASGPSPKEKREGTAAAA